MIRRDNDFYSTLEEFDPLAGRKKKSRIFPMLFVFVATLIVIFGSLALIVLL